MSASRFKTNGSTYLSVVAAILVGFAPVAFGAGKTISMDGVNTEWDGGDLLYGDAEITDGTPANSSYANVYVANDEDHLYFGLETKGSGGGDILNLWTHSIYLDTDTNSATGYNGGTWSGGYDRLVLYGDDGFEFYSYAFAGGANQSTPNWSPGPFVNYAYSDSFIEIEVPLADLGLALGDAIRIQLVVSGTGVTVETLAHASEASARIYTLEDATPPPALTVTLDGDLSEWGSEYVFYTDGQISDGEPLNSTYNNIYAANDAEFLYIGYDVKGSGGGQFSNDWRRQVLIDTDNNPATGHNGGAGWMAHGYDCLVEWGAGGMSATVNSFAGPTQDAWAWNYAGPLSYGFSDNVVELGVSRTFLGMGVDVQAVLEFVVTDGSVVSQTWAHVDEPQARTFTFAPTGNNVPVSRTIVLDGDLSDWGPEYVFYNDSEIVDGLPTNSTYSAILVANDEDFLYCGFDVKGSGGGDWSNAWARQVYIDSDDNPATGFNGNWMIHGYDRLVEWGWTASAATIYSFAGGANQAAFSWSELGPIDFGYSDNVVEWGLPRSLLGVGTNNQVVLEFSVPALGGVTLQTYAHEFEGLAKDYVFTTRPIIDAMSIAGGMVELDISGLLPGSTVTVNRAVSLDPPGWAGTTPFVSSGTSTNWTGPLGGSANEFFGVRRDGP